MDTSTSTTLVNDTPSAGALSSQLTRANIFGFFVTLQICQLTQPHGSLLFRRVRGVLWRTNPVSSFVEAFIIFCYLARPAWNLCKTLPARLTMFRRKVRRDGLWKGLLASSTPWREHLCDPASALLLLRGAMGYDDDVELLQKLMEDSFELQEAHVVTLTANQSTSSHSGPAPRSASNESSHGGENKDLRSAATITASEPATSTPAQPVTLQLPGVQRRWTELESGHSPRSQPNTSPSAINPDIDSERAKLLHRAFGSNALAHGEKQIDIVTTAATLIILLKLIVIHQAPWFTTYALLTISGWVAVQLLLVLFHSREMSDVDMVASVRQARLINADLLKTAHIWKGMYLIMHMPILGYVSYLMAFRFHMPYGLHWLGTITLVFWLLISGFLVTLGGLMIGAPGGAMGVLLFFYNFIVGVFVDRSLDDAIDALIKLLGCALASCLSVWVWVGYYTYVTKWLLDLNPDEYGPYQPFFGDHRSLNLLVDEVFLHAMLGLLFLIVLAYLSIGFWNVFVDIEKDANDAEYQYLISGGNTLITIAAFTWLLIEYNAEGTYKPNW